MPTLRGPSAPDRSTDAYVAAFTLPDFLNYIVAGGAASITFISIYTRFLAEKRDADAQKTFSIIITVMTAVMIVGTIADGDFRAAVCALVRERISRRTRSISASISREFCFRRRSSFMWAEWFRRCCFRTGCFCFRRLGR